MNNTQAKLETSKRSAYAVRLYIYIYIYIYITLYALLWASDFTKQEYQHYQRAWHNYLNTEFRYTRW
jgi:hypothetical protein